jgi:hypothetical protein
VSVAVSSQANEFGHAAFAVQLRKHPFTTLPLVVVEALRTQTRPEPQSLSVLHPEVHQPLVALAVFPRQ